MPRVSDEETRPSTQLLSPDANKSQNLSPSGYTKLDSDDTSEGDEKRHMEKSKTVTVTEV